MSCFKKTASVFKFLFLKLPLYILGVVVSQLKISNLGPVLQSRTERSHFCVTLTAPFCVVFGKIASSEYFWKVFLKVIISLSQKLLGLYTRAASTMLVDSANLRSQRY